jgi:ABC-2 type transport system permease protein
MRKFLLIAQREYVERVKGKPFLLTTILVPVVVGGMIAVFSFAMQSKATGKHLLVASNDATLAASVHDQMTKKKVEGMVVDVEAPMAEADKDQLIRHFDSNHLDGLLWLSAAPGQMQPDVTYYANGSPDLVTTGRVEDAISRALIARQLTAGGMAGPQVDALLKDVHVSTLAVKNGKVSHESAAKNFWTAYLMSFLLSFTGIMYGMNVGRSIIEEKTSRIFEVMLASVTPDDMMFGKLIGVGAVGLTQIGIWIALAAGFLGSSMASQFLSGSFRPHIPVVQVVLFCVYFLLGYLFYSALSAGLAATVSTEQELQQFWPINAVPVWLSFGMIGYIISNPNGIWSIVLSYIPPCAPITIFLRMGAGTVPPYQIAVSIGIMVASVYALIWFSSRLYRVGILMYGKRATLPEILRWIRYS